MSHLLRKLAASAPLQLALLLPLGCGGFETPATKPDGSNGAGGDSGDTPSTAICRADDDSPLPGTHPVGFHVVGNRIEDSRGLPTFLRGVNRSGSEYRCVQGNGFFDGPCDEASVAAMKAWNINTVRVPLNEACWLGVNGAPEDLSLDSYKQAILSYVHLLHKYELIPILELHWSAPLGEAADGLDPMPNADHSIAFWQDVATTFRDDQGVIFEPFNEPFPGGNRDSDAAWSCWRDGCETSTRESPAPWRAVGMQELVTAIRETGAEQLILLGGVQFSNGLSRWLEFKPEDPLSNLAPAWHIYNFNPCADIDCWNTAPLQLAQEYPIVATEIGQDDCAGDFIGPLMSFLDQNGAGYLAWSWNVLGQCEPAGEDVRGNPWPLIEHYATGEPNGDYAKAFYDHVQEMTR